MANPAGYRVVRKLGCWRAGGRSPRTLPGSDDAEPSAALKVFGADVDDSSIATEVAALSAARSAHVVRLVDVAAGTGEPRCLVLERLGWDHSVCALLRERTSVRTGEGRSRSWSRHARGLEGSPSGRVRSRSRHTRDRHVHVETGRPVLIGLGHAVAAAETSNASDYAQLGIIAQALLSRVNGRSAPGPSTP